MPGSAGINVSGIWTKNLHYLEQSVAHWVLSGHAMAVMIPAVTKDSIVTRSDLDLDDYAHTLDGLVLQGGNDVAPETYGETPLHPDWAGDRVRDRYEIELIDAFVRAGKPVFGICRGLQLLNVVFGGTLLQDIATQRPDVARAPRRLDLRAPLPRHRAGAGLASWRSCTRACSRPRSTRSTTRRSRTWRPASSVEACCPDDGMIEAMRRSGPAYVAGGAVAPRVPHPRRSRQLQRHAAAATTFCSARARDARPAARAAGGSTRRD